MYIDREEYTRHIIDPVKKIEVRKILDKIEMVLNKHIIQSTDFLDPYEISLAISVLNRFTDIKYHIDGGLKDLERKIINIYPDYLSKEDIGNPISSLKIRGNLENINHKDYLGSILNLGLKRNKIGDILVYDDYAIIFVKEEIRDYLIYNLEKVKNTSVKVSSNIIDDISLPRVEYKEINKFLISLRLDSIISATLNVSRKESINIIKVGKVKVNWENIDKASKDIKQGDLISVKGYGRFTLHEVKGRSKSNRFICVIRILL